MRVQQRHGGFRRDDLMKRAGFVRPVTGKVAPVRDLMTKVTSLGLDAAGDLVGSTIGQQDAVIAVDDQQRVRDRVNHRLQEGRRLPERFVHLPPPRNFVDRGTVETPASRCARTRRPKSRPALPLSSTLPGIDVSKVTENFALP